MACTDKQVRKLLMEYEKSHEIEKSSLKANMCRQTGSKYTSNPVVILRRQNRSVAGVHGRILLRMTGR